MLLLNEIVVSLHVLYWCWALLKNDCQAAMKGLQDACIIANKQHSGFLSNMGGFMHMMCIDWCWATLRNDCQAAMA